MRLPVITLLAALAAAAPATAAFTDAAVGPGNRASAAAMFAPKPVTPPTITGDAVEGAELTGHVGDWGRQPERLETTWVRCAAERCEPVGAGATYRLTAVDAGARLRFRVVATNAAGTTAAESEPTVPVTPAGATNLTAPAISGTAAHGATLTASPGTWSRPATLTYTWLRCTAQCREVGSAAAYTLTDDDVGATVRVRVTADGRTSAESAPTATVTGPYRLTVRNDRPSWWWRFEEPAGAALARNETADAGHGRYLGGAFTTTGAVGRAAQVGEGAHLDFGDLADLDGNRPFTVEFLVRPDAIGGWRPILAKLTGLSGVRQGWDVYLTPWGHVQCERWRDNAADWVASEPLTLGTWAHVACVYDGTSMRIVVDGRERSARPASRLVPATTGSLLAATDELGQRFNGWLDELAIWNGSALTTGQVAAHHAAR